MLQMFQLTDKDERTCVRVKDVISQCGMSLLTLKPPTDVISSVAVSVTLRHGECMSFHGPLVMMVASDTATYNNDLLLSECEVYSSDDGDDSLMYCIFKCYLSDPVNYKVSICLLNHLHNAMEICEIDIQQWSETIVWGTVCPV